MIRRVDQLTEAHFGRVVTVHGIAGPLTDVIPHPNGRGVVLGMRLGTPLLYTDLLPCDTPVEIGPRP